MYRYSKYVSVSLIYLNNNMCLCILSCAICSTFILKDKVNDFTISFSNTCLFLKAWFDRGFQNEIQHLSTTCLECEWTGSLKLYQVDDMNNLSLYYYIIFYRIIVIKIIKSVPRVPSQTNK
jgi:hypothetical protein